MTTWYGMSQDRASAVFRSFDPSSFMVYFVAEDDPENRTPDDLNELAVQMRDAFDDDRRIVAVVSGGASHLRSFRDGLDESVFEAVVMVAPINALKSLGVEVLDEHWQEGDPQVFMDEVLGDGVGVRRGARVRTIHDGTRGVVSRRLGARFARVVLVGTTRPITVPVWAITLHGED